METIGKLAPLGPIGMMSELVSSAVDSYGLVVVQLGVAIAVFSMIKIYRKATGCKT